MIKVIYAIFAIPTKDRKLSLNKQNRLLGKNALGFELYDQKNKNISTLYNFLIITAKH